MIRIEQATETDRPVIDTILRTAFERPDEGELVATLRRDGAMWSEWLALERDEVQGYAALSRMRGPEGWACLAPVAVRPIAQGRGIGGALVRHAAAQVGYGPEVVVVLGEAEYYARHGFDRDRGRDLKSPYPPEHTLVAGGGNMLSATLIYPAAFG